MSRRRRNLNNNGSEDASFEIDLSPLLALMVTLIPMMLLATVFVKVTIVETALPQAVQKAIEEDRKKKERVVTIELKMSDNKEFELFVKINQKTSYRKKLKESDFKKNLEYLHTELVKVKKDHPKIFQIQFMPSDGVAYEDIVKVMDEARELKVSDEKIYIKDKESQKDVEMKVMFPDLIFNNIIEG